MGCGTVLLVSAIVMVILVVAAYAFNAGGKGSVGPGIIGSTVARKPLPGRLRERDCLFHGHAGLDWKQDDAAIGTEVLLSEDGRPALPLYHRHGERLTRPVPG